MFLFNNIILYKFQFVQWAWKSGMFPAHRFSYYKQCVINQEAQQTCSIPYDFLTLRSWPLALRGYRVQVVGKSVSLWQTGILSVNVPKCRDSCRSGRSSQSRGFLPDTILSHSMWECCFFLTQQKQNLFWIKVVLLPHKDTTKATVAVREIHF